MAMKWQFFRLLQADEVRPYHRTLIGSTGADPKSHVQKVWTICCLYLTIYSSLFGSQQDYNSGYKFCSQGNSCEFLQTYIPLQLVKIYARHMFRSGAKLNHNEVDSH